MKTFTRNTIFQIIFLVGIIVSFQQCTSDSKTRPEWADVNEQLIQDNNLEVRLREDFPDIDLETNLKAGEVKNLSAIPVISLAEGVTAKAYWGKGVLMSYITLAPNASLPEETIEGERFLVVVSGDVDELINGNYVNLKSFDADSPDGIHGATKHQEFLYLQQGAKTAVKAGDDGAKILEVFSPVPTSFLAKAGVEEIPEQPSIPTFPVKATVEPNKVYDLNDFQYSELVPGANSRIVSGNNIQLSFLRMDPLTSFARHIHPEEQVMTTLRGWIDEIILDGVVQMKEGDLLRLPGNMVHGGDIGPLGCDVIDVFFPPRADYEESRASRQAGYNKIIPEDAEVKLVIDGAVSEPTLYFTEGPVWVDGNLYFSNMYFDVDWNGNPAKSTLVKMSADGKYSNVIQGKMQTNGMIEAKNGNLIVCDMFGHRIIEVDKKGNVLRTIADSYDGKKLDGPNDLVMDSKGGIYFTDPQFTPDAEKNQPGRTVYYINPEGKIIRILEPDEFAMANGIALSPDGGTLYVNNTYDDEDFWNVDTDKDNFVWAYDVNEDGTIENGRKFAQLYLTAEVLDRQGKSSGADGMKVDALGNLYVATYAGLQIFDSEGNFVGIVNFPTYPVNCCFGGPENKTLYITSYDKIYSIETNVEGL
ncbi:MAG TPA: SMP-30/gluconolactonase/LRE family protein [Draconibacterium sp.]|nr:SMP-30/gluconolactonase/LRE family protein [Draconibacterium sp.]